MKNMLLLWPRFRRFLHCKLRRGQHIATTERVIEYALRTTVHVVLRCSCGAFFHGPQQLREDYELAMLDAQLDRSRRLRT